MMKNLVLSMPVQIAIILVIGAIIVAAFVTHQTTALGSLLSLLASTLGAFLYRSSWLHNGSLPPAPIVPSLQTENLGVPSDKS